jgi:hypothetical protein
MDYIKHYNLLINKASDRLYNGYTETHHILPRCLGGSNLKKNLVKLTPEEHFVAHQLLVKIYPTSSGLLYALARLSGGKTKVRSNKIYGWIKRRLSIERSNAMKGHTIWVGKRHSEESKKKISIALTGRKRIPTTRISTAKGKPNPNKSHSHSHTDEVKRRISESKTGIPKKKIECPHCGKLSAPHLAYRYHFNSCKMINIPNSP